MGGQKGIAFFNRYLSKLVKFSCITVQANTEVCAEGYPVKNILSNSSSRYVNLFYFFTLSRIIRKEKITHIIIEHPYYGWLGILLKWFCKVKLIMHSHNIEALRFKSLNKWWWGILWHYEKTTHRVADQNFFIQDDDRNYAIKNFNLDPGTCTTITYGFELSQPPGRKAKRSAREVICKIHGISEPARLLLFNGTLGYKPNLDALDTILDKINPQLLHEENFRYKIIVCGNKLPVEYNGLKAHKDKNIIYAGFVDDINLYFKGCDIFINPVIDGGGIKTKVVEALGNDLSVISTKSGSIGIPVEITGKKMQIVADNDWSIFSDLIRTLNPEETIPSVYFDHFYWGNIAGKAAAQINGVK